MTVVGCGEWSVYRGRPNSVLLRSAGFADPVADAEIIRLRAELAAMAEAYAEYRRRIYAEALRFETWSRTTTPGEAPDANAQHCKHRWVGDGNEVYCEKCGESA